MINHNGYLSLRLTHRFTLHKGTIIYKIVTGVTSDFVNKSWQSLLHMSSSYKLYNIMFPKILPVKTICRFKEAQHSEYWLYYGPPQDSKYKVFEVLNAVDLNIYNNLMLS